MAPNDARWHPDDIQMTARTLKGRGYNKVKETWLHISVLYDSCGSHRALLEELRDYLFFGLLGVDQGLTLISRGNSRTLWENSGTLWESSGTPWESSGALWATSEALWESSGTLWESLRCQI